MIESVVLQAWMRSEQVQNLRPFHLVHMVEWEEPTPDGFRKARITFLSHEGFHTLREREEAELMQSLGAGE